ncbi:hypothetical protein MMC34_001369 [Xylographa carneopallida]|nr:hypothetical protein [Xylographa carneopallida]
MLLALCSVVAGFHEHKGGVLVGRGIQRDLYHAGSQPSSELASIGTQPVQYYLSKQAANKRWAELQNQNKMYKRMLSQMLKKQKSLSSIGYVFQALSDHDIAAYNIHNVAISGGLSQITSAAAQQYTTNALRHVLDHKPFKQVVLVDIYGTGASKEEYARLLEECENVMKMPKHTLKPVQIPIIDANQKRPTSKGVPFLGPLS